MHGAALKPQPHMPRDKVARLARTHKAKAAAAILVGANGLGCLTNMAKIRTTDATGYVQLFEDLAQLGGVTNQPTQPAGITLTAKIVVQGVQIDNLHNVPGR